MPIEDLESVLKSLTTAQASVIRSALPPSPLQPAKLVWSSLKPSDTLLPADSHLRGTPSDKNWDGFSWVFKQVMEPLGLWLDEGPPDGAPRPWNMPSTCATRTLLCETSFELNTSDVLRCLMRPTFHGVSRYRRMVKCGKPCPSDRSATLIV